ncbi:hypothetical protein Poly30_03790 [Planctomycetes bacterium Poly30]|uniref:Uncharacterized protein n=1 Tax=Saltatorellus ferox TaxID=2528018 RepID=A0A518ELB0_9BACT|nr:hypothetical protein Poly30_03790 [Planctomycetes bacterium Poly30]
MGEAALQLLPETVEANMKNERELKIEEPCPMRWAELLGAGSRRYCGQCALHVVDGSAMTKAAAKRLVEDSSERVCMRVELDEGGRPVYLPETSSQGKRLAGLGLVVASGMLVACTDDAPSATHPDPEPGPTSSNSDLVDEPLARPPEIMGEVCYPPEPVDEGHLSQRPEAMGKMVVGPVEESGVAPKSPAEDE